MYIVCLHLAIMFGCVCVCVCVGMCICFVFGGGRGSAPHAYAHAPGGTPLYRYVCSYSAHAWTMITSVAVRLILLFGTEIIKFLCIGKEL